MLFDHPPARHIRGRLIVFAIEQSDRPPIMPRDATDGRLVCLKREQKLAFGQPRQAETRDAAKAKIHLAALHAKLEWISRRALDDRAIAPKL